MGTEARPGLGRRHSPDPRDRDYPLAELLPRRAAASYRYWPSNRVLLDQGQTDRCVGFSWTHWLTDSPTTHTIRALNVRAGGAANATDETFTQSLYDQAQQVDEFPDTPPAGGTSVRAGAKVLQGWGFIGSYHWASGIEDVVNYLLTSGTCVFGTDWLDSMFSPDRQSDGTYLLDVSGGVAGGHAYKLDGVNLNRGLVRIKNSWGDWANRGHAYMRIEDAERLLRANGEACAAVEP